MQSEGVSRKELRQNHHMTEWGARKFTDILPTQTEEEETPGGRHNRKIFYLDRPFEKLDQETKQTQIPVNLNNTELNREPRKAKQTQTKQMNDYLSKLEKTVKQVDAPEIEWSEKPEASSMGADVVFHDTDNHFGSTVENKHGETIYSTETAKERHREKTQEFVDYTVRQRVVNTIDTVHWLLGGDMVEGTGIYSGQAHEVDMYINKQVETATEELTKTMKRLVKLCNHIGADLQIVCIPGNHGKNRSGGSSNKANYDDLVYYNLQHATDIFLEENGDVDVRFQRSDSVVEDTFPLRAGSYTGYLCHGQHMKTHVGTSSGQKDALSIVSEYGADIIFRGHYHMNKVEDVNGVPVVMTGSIKPGGPHEKTLQAYGPPSSAFYTVTDDEIIENVKTLTF